MKNKKIIIIIPVRMGSKRLRDKNILPIKNKPMFVYVAEQVLRSNYGYKLFISSESQFIKKICSKYNLSFIKRPKKLSGPEIEKQEAIVHAVKFLIKKNLNFDFVVSLQANSPQIKYKDLDKAINFFLKNNKKGKILNEVISVGTDNLQNGAFRIMKKKTVFQKTLSTKVGIFVADYIDIHNKKDYLKALKSIQ